jgi:hypothetical protein
VTAPLAEAAADASGRSLESRSSSGLPDRRPPPLWVAVVACAAPVGAVPPKNILKKSENSSDPVE